MAAKGFRAVTLAETTKSSHPEPGSQFFMYSLDSGLGTRDTASNPAAWSWSSRSATSGAPATPEEGIGAVDCEGENSRGINGT